MKSSIRQTVVNADHWTCSDCEKRVVWLEWMRYMQHRCYQCHKYAADSALLRCSFPDCSHFFHKECLPTNERYQLQPTFVCPSHFCSFCKCLEETTNPVIYCTRCAKSYHRSCLPSFLVSLDEGHLLCMRHRFVWTP